MPSTHSDVVGQLNFIFMGKTAEAIENLLKFVWKFELLRKSKLFSCNNYWLTIWTDVRSSTRSFGGSHRLCNRNLRTFNKRISENM